jgi:hypothetical protein
MGSGKRRKPPQQQQPSPHSRNQNFSNVKTESKEVTPQTTIGGTSSWIWRFIDVSLILAVIGFAYWIGGLSNQVAEQKEKLKDACSNTSGDIKDLRSKIGIDIKDLETRISNGGVLIHRYQGETSDLHRRRQFQFMTPSNETWDSKRSFYGQSPARGGGEAVRLDEFDWQKATDAKIEEFGREIIAKGFTKGWRRYPYAGQGRYRDVGWWWVVTVEDSFNIEHFVDYYRRFWGTNEMYVEEFEAKSDVMPDGVIPHPVLPNTSAPAKER